jgi:hypothetical protein
MPVQRGARHAEVLTHRTQRQPLDTVPLDGSHGGLQQRTA